MDPAEYAAQAEELIRADCMMISGCEDHQTSADVGNVSQFELPDPAGRSGGACTSALLNVLYGDHKDHSNDLSFVQVLRQMRKDLQKGRFTQNPQLSSSRAIDLSQKFHVVNPSGGGTKRALLIGINYVGQNGELSGCHNDALNIKQYLMKCHGFEAQNMTVLLDDGSHRSPTRENIMKSLETLVKQSRAGDSVFLHYSGHGGNLADDNGDEEDGRDETLIPVDFQQTGQIRDDVLLEKFIVPMASGVTVTCLMDCCHSGSILDLPYMFTADGNSQNISNPQMQQNTKFDYKKVAGVAFTVLPAAWRAYQRAKNSSDPFSACIAFATTLLPLLQTVAGEVGKARA